MAEYITKEQAFELLGDGDMYGRIALTEMRSADVIERSKIDKAIEYIMQYSSMQANPYKREGMRRAIELLKQKIGE